MSKPKILYISDLNYRAAGRDYFREDLEITAYLQAYFSLIIVHPRQAIHFLDAVDKVVMRNSGPVCYYLDDFNAFRDKIQEKGLPVYNSLQGKGDQQGKSYLIELYELGFPVIPSRVESVQDDPNFEIDKWVIKPIMGADSIGLQIIDELIDIPPDHLVQPWLTDLEYEVSFYYVNNVFIYGLYTPDRGKRWQLVPYSPTAEDLLFAQRFIDWNGLSHGIQRVDAARLSDGRLLLVELEDLNPYLSLAELPERTRNQFMDRWIAALHRL